MQLNETRKMTITGLKALFARACYRLGGEIEFRGHSTLCVISAEPHDITDVLVDADLLLMASKLIARETGEPHGLAILEAVDNEELRDTVEIVAHPGDFYTIRVSHYTVEGVEEDVVEHIGESISEKLEIGDNEYYVDAYPVKSDHAWFGAATVETTAWGDVDHVIEAAETALQLAEDYANRAVHFVTKIKE